MKTVRMAMACDDRYLPGAIGTLASARMALEPEIDMEVFFMHEELSNESIERIKIGVSRVHGKTSFTFHQIREDFSAFPDFFFPSKLAYARLLLPELLGSGRLLYVDADILWLKSPWPLFQTNLEGAAVGAVVERGMPTLASDPPVGLPIECDLHQPYFNSGVLLLDLDKLRQTGVFMEAARILTDYPRSHKYWDQSALNYSINGNFKLLESSWNLQNHYQNIRPCDLLDGLSKKTLNIHFVTKAKPWLRWSPFPAESMFRLLVHKVDTRFALPASRRSLTTDKYKFRFAYGLTLFYRLRAIFKGNCMSDINLSAYWAQMHNDLKELHDRRSHVSSLLSQWDREIKSKVYSNF